MSEPLKARVVSLGEVGAAAWDACLPPDRNPFLSHAFLRALEESGSACPATGWAPVPIAVFEGDEVVGVAPVYAKGHSMGEFMFDWGWADAYERAGGRYYPKLQVAVPFSPIPGPRLLCRVPAARRVLVAGLLELGERLGCSSAHLTFCTREEAEKLSLMGFAVRHGVQFHWPNHGYSSFEDFLGALSSRKRKAVKKERSAAQSLGLELQTLTGAELTERVWDEFFPVYTDTYDRKWGDPPLTRSFFSLLGSTMGDSVVLFRALKGGRTVAAALNLIGPDALYGRNWGCLGDYPFLHFELCYYQAIELAIARGLKRVEAGVQGPHKLARGYLPVTTYGCVHFYNPGFQAAIADFTRTERVRAARERELLSAHSPYREG